MSTSPPIMLKLFTLGFALAPFSSGLSLGVIGGGVALTAGGYTAHQSVSREVDNHEALQLARSTVSKKLSEMEAILMKLKKLKLHSTMHGSNALDTILQENKEVSSSRIHEIIDSRAVGSNLKVGRPDNVISNSVAAGGFV